MQEDKWDELIDRIKIGTSTAQDAKDVAVILLENRFYLSILYLIAAKDDSSALRIVRVLRDSGLL